MLYVKYGKNRLHGFRGDVVWKSWQTTDDDGRTTDIYLYFGSGELNILDENLTRALDINTYKVYAMFVEYSKDFEETFGKTSLMF